MEQLDRVILSIQRTISGGLTREQELIDHHRRWQQPQDLLPKVVVREDLALADLAQVHERFVVRFDHMEALDDARGSGLDAGQGAGVRECEDNEAVLVVRGVTFFFVVKEFQMKRFLSALVLQRP